jgi:hypothetical protein
MPFGFKQSWAADGQNKAQLNFLSNGLLVLQDN